MRIYRFCHLSTFFFSIKDSENSLFACLIFGLNDRGYYIILAQLELILLPLVFPQPRYIQETTWLRYIREP